MLRGSDSDDDDDKPVKRRRSSLGTLPTQSVAEVSFGESAQQHEYSDDEDLGYGNGASHQAPGWSDYKNTVEEDFMCSQTDNPAPPRTPHDARAGGAHEMQGEFGRKRHPKSIQDRVHGQIQLDGLLVAVMDTAEFQRLDRIKQLGGCVYVYPSATHTRKEHSIGVAYLAGYMARHLQCEQPELGIDAADVLCVELAGLAHDLGHGPFSHMFETFMKLQEKAGATHHWEHEPMSEKLLRELIERNRIPIWEYFDESEGSPLWRQHLNFAVNLISGLSPEKTWPTDLGRGPEKRFLFDIVSNARNGIDVDKLDYLVRDSMACFGSPKPPGFDIYRIIKGSRVLLRDTNADGRRLYPEV